MDRKTWIKKLDKLFFEAIKIRDKVCKKCGKRENLAPSHIYPKGRYTRLRWEMDNALLMDWNCHLNWWHKHPIEAGEWFKEKYPERAKKLRLKSQVIDKSKIDYKAIELYLLQKIKNNN